MKTRGKKRVVGGVSIECLEGRMLLSGDVREVSGSVFYDPNTNLRQDAGEAPVVGATIYTDLNLDAKQDDGELATTTDENGHYSLMTNADITRLAVVRPAGWRLVANFHSDLTPNVRTFPMGPVPVITGTVFEDDDANGYTGASKPRAGVGVFIDRNNNGLLDGGEESVVSDSQGIYRFEDVDPPANGP